MSGIEFFTSRYGALGWEYQEIEFGQAIRINRMNTQKTSIAERLQSKGLQLEEIPFLEDGYWVSGSRFSVGSTPEYLLGLYSVQEAAAQIPATLFTGLRNKMVLDACAAPGGKTVQLADLMQNTGAIVALDIDRRRLAALSNQLERCRAKNAIVYKLDATQASRLRIKFERILLDVPCSGNFVGQKDWFSRRTIEDIEKNAELQREILTETVRVLTEDGEIIYSTCSLEPEEDELNVDWAIRNLNLKVEEIDCYGEKGLTSVFGKQIDNSLEKCKRIWPGKTQGFFICKLKKGVAA